MSSCGPGFPGTFLASLYTLENDFWLDFVISVVSAPSRHIKGLIHIFT